jgi:hypothetical protein
MVFGKPVNSVWYQHKIVHKVKNQGWNNHYYITWFLWLKFYSEQIVDENVVNQIKLIIYAKNLFT